MGVKFLLQTLMGLELKNRERGRDRQKKRKNKSEFFFGMALALLCIKWINKSSGARCVINEIRFCCRVFANLTKSFFFNIQQTVRKAFSILSIPEHVLAGESALLELEVIRTLYTPAAEPLMDCWFVWVKDVVGLCGCRMEFVCDILGLCRCVI